MKWNFLTSIQTCYFIFANHQNNSNFFCSISSLNRNASTHKPSPLSSSIREETKPPQSNKLIQTVTDRVNHVQVGIKPETTDPNRISHHKQLGSNDEQQQRVDPNRSCSCSTMRKSRNGTRSEEAQTVKHSCLRSSSRNGTNQSQASKEEAQTVKQFVKQVGVFESESEQTKGKLRETEVCCPIFFHFRALMCSSLL